MEGVSEMGWSPSFNYTTMPAEESDFIIAQLLGGCEQDAEMSFSVPSLFCSDLVNTDYTNYLNSQDANASFCGYWPQESFNVNASSSLFSLPMDTGSMNVVGPAMNCNTEQVTFSGCFRSQEDTSTEAFGDSGTNSVKTGLNERLMHKRKFSMVEVNMNADYDDNKINANAFDDSKKKAKVTSQIQKGSKKQKLRNTLQKSISSSGEEEDRSNVQSSDCCSSEDESNASQELNRGRSPSSSSKGSPALNLNGKTRATRGSATDPQSLYARKRRERINERLRTLQNLVPNGTKVDISTMLEAAVQYVKFLQLQIKLLSSDELWMYAPLAYNGVGIGL